MFVYVSTLYTSRGDIIGADLVKFTSLDDVEFEFIHKNRFRELREKLDAVSAIKDFKFKDNFQIEPMYHKPKVIEVPLSDLELYTSKDSSYTSSHITSLYDLLRDLSKYNCLYINDECDLKNLSNYILPSFNKLRVSSSTMSILISMYEDKVGWRSKKIIAVNSNGTLNQQTYHFAVLNKNVSSFTKYRLPMISNVKIGGLDYTIFKYTSSLPISSSLGSDYRFCEPLICHIMQKVKYCEGILTSLRFIQSKLITKCASDSISESKSFLNQVNKSGVFFENIPKTFDNNLIESETLAILGLKLKLAKEGKPLDYNVISNYLNEHHLNGYLGPILAVVNDCFEFTEDFNISNSTLENVITSINTYSDYLLDLKLFLYNERVNCIINPKSLIYYGLDGGFTISGGGFGNRVFVRRENDNA